MQIFDRRSKKMSLRRNPNEAREPAMGRSEDRENETGTFEEHQESHYDYGGVILTST